MKMGLTVEQYINKMPILERMDKFLTEKNPNTSLKEKEFSNRRDRKLRRQQFINKDKKLACYKYLYIPALVGMVGGGILLLGSTIKSISEGSFFWIHRDVLQVIGPTLLVIGLVFLLLATGLVTWRRTKVKEENGLNSSFNSSYRSRRFSQDSGTMSRQSSVRSDSEGGCIKNSKREGHPYSKMKQKSKPESVTEWKHCNGNDVTESGDEKQVYDTADNINMVNEYITQVWIQRSDMVPAYHNVDENQQNGHINARNKQKWKKWKNKHAKRPDSTNLNFKSEMETIYESNSSNSSSVGSSSMESTMS